LEITFFSPLHIDLTVGKLHLLLNKKKCKTVQVALTNNGRERGGKEKKKRKTSLCLPPQLFPFRLVSLASPSPSSSSRPTSKP
jgi:hypothetical protein